jgi:hypothetical protein
MVLRATNFSDSLHVIAMYSDFNSRICSSLLQMKKGGMLKIMDANEKKLWYGNKV